MAEHHYIERDTDSGVATGMVLAIVIVLLLGIVALFVFFGGPGRFVGGTTPSNTNINVPPPAQQSQPQTQPAPNINIQPPQIQNPSGNPSGNGPQAPSNSGSGAPNRAPAPGSSSSGANR